ncbi:MAG: type II toxin-antitoxin system PemK/MazF family toxin [Bacillota bacterium]
MMIFNKREVILIPFPFSDLSSSKKRPAAVLACIPSREELICMMLTSTKNTDAVVDVPINNLEQSGLVKPTYARTSRLFTITYDMVIKKLGVLAEPDFNSIIKNIINYLKY